MSFDPSTLLGAAIGAGASSLFGRQPSVPNVNIPPPPSVGLPAAYNQPLPAATNPIATPNAPITASDTAALQRARMNQKGGGGPSSLVLTPSKNRDMSSTNASGGMVTRTTLLGR